jgi:hypothetical protein
VTTNIAWALTKGAAGPLIIIANWTSSGAQRNMLKTLRGLNVFALGKLSDATIEART